MKIKNLFKGGKNVQTRQIFTVCDADTEGVEEPYNSIKGKVCLHVIKEEYTAEEFERIKAEAEKLVIRKIKSSGDGWSYGQARNNMSNDGENEPLALDHVVVENGKIIGGLIKGSWRRSTMDGDKGYSRFVFLPIGASLRKIEYCYYYHVYPFDGTSSEHVCEISAAIK